jgi:hypothetical protein
MLILCLLRHDQTLDLTSPSGSAPARNRNQMARVEQFPLMDGGH